LKNSLQHPTHHKKAVHHVAVPRRAAGLLQGRHHHDVSLPREPLRYYHESEGIEFEMMTVGADRTTLVPWKLGNEAQQKKEIRERVVLYEGPFNSVGSRPKPKPGERGERGRPKSPMTMTWYKNQLKLDKQGKPRLVPANVFISIRYERLGFASRSPRRSHLAHISPANAFDARRSALRGPVEDNILSTT
jgi:hypothetical protein